MFLCRLLSCILQSGPFVWNFPSKCGRSIWCLLWQLIKQSSLSVAASNPQSRFVITTFPKEWFFLKKKKWKIFNRKKNCLERKKKCFFTKFVNQFNNNFIIKKKLKTKINYCLLYFMAAVSFTFTFIIIFFPFF